jgi:hypothetical protein
MQEMYCFTYYLNFVSTLYLSGYFEYVLLIVFVIFLLQFIGESCRNRTTFFPADASLQSFSTFFNM